METHLSRHLTVLSERYVGATGISLATISERAAGDWRFFKSVASGSLNFRIRSYDRAMAWFDANWPDNVAWPDDVPRPSPAASPGDQPTEPPPSVGSPSADAPPPASAEPLSREAAE